MGRKKGGKSQNQVKKDGDSSQTSHTDHAKRVRGVAAMLDSNASSSERLRLLISLSLMTSVQDNEETVSKLSDAISQQLGVDSDRMAAYEKALLNRKDSHHDLPPELEAVKALIKDNGVKIPYVEPAAKEEAVDTNEETDAPNEGDSGDGQTGGGTPDVAGGDEASNPHLAFEDVKEIKVAKWMQDQVKKEIDRVRQHGANAIPVPVKNTSITKEGNKIVNRVEVNTAFDFDKVKQIMVSEPIPCPEKKGYSYVNVLCFTDKPVPLILPFLFEPTKNNKLLEWVFISNNFARSRHHIDNFEDVQADDGDSDDEDDEEQLEAVKEER